MKFNFTILILCLTILSFANTAFSQDAGVDAVISPAPGSVLSQSSSYSVVVVIKNFGTTTLSSIPVQFQVGTNVITDTYSGSLAPGDTVQFTFSSQLTISSTSSTFGAATTTLSGDANMFNDATQVSYSFATGIHDWDGKSNLMQMYPNPSTGLITLTIDPEVDVNDISISIYSIDGRQMPLAGNKVSILHNGLSIDLGNIDTGYYFVRLSASDGKQLTKRLTILR